MEIRGQEEAEGEVGLAKAASGPSHASVTLRLLLRLCRCPSCWTQLFLFIFGYNDERYYMALSSKEFLSIFLHDF